MTILEGSTAPFFIPVKGFFPMNLDLISISMLLQYTAKQRHDRDYKGKKDDFSRGFP
jgi:hypothetical protein